MKETNNSPTQKVKLTLGQRIKKSIFVGTKEDVKDSFIDDILFPSIRDFFVDSLYNMVDVMVFGRDEHGYRGRARRRGSYDRPSSRNRTPTDYAREGQAARQNGRTKTSSRYIFEGVKLYDHTDEYGEFHRAADMADDIIDALHQLMARNTPHQVTVYEFYDECQQTGEWIDQEWGWKEKFGPADDIGVRLVGDHIELIMPEPEYLGPAIR